VSFLKSRSYADSGDLGFVNPSFYRWSRAGSKVFSAKYK